MQRGTVPASPSREPRHRLARATHLESWLARHTSFGGMDLQNCHSHPSHGRTDDDQAPGNPPSKNGMCIPSRVKTVVVSASSPPEEPGTYSGRSSAQRALLTPYQNVGPYGQRGHSRKPTLIPVVVCAWGVRDRCILVAGRGLVVTGCPPSQLALAPASRTSHAKTNASGVCWSDVDCASALREPLAARAWSKCSATRLSW